MRIFIDKGFKLQFMVVTAVLLSFLILAQMLVTHIANDYKQNMVAHDYRVAGYLTHSGLEREKITLAFTSQKTDKDMDEGQKLLQAAGYTGSIQNSLLPEVERFQQKYTMILLILTIAFSAVILSGVLYFELRRDKKIENAVTNVQSFMGGNIHVRLDDHAEGSLSLLFASVNAMATSLTAHIAKEKENTEFLQDTISDISHQLKTPLTALRMYNEIIQDEKTVNDVVESFTLKSERELNRMEKLIQNLLKLAKLDAGSIELEKVPHSLKEFFEECIKGFRTRTELENKLLFLHCEQQITFNFDEEWMLEAVGNIIKNALDHTDAGDRIDIRCDETPVFLEITIKDNGTGIHPEDIHHIFKRFYRSRFSKDKQGVGIGLALSHAIVEKHGGSITVESELGKGTAFHLTFSKLANM